MLNHWRAILTLIASILPVSLVLAVEYQQNSPARQLIPSAFTSVIAASIEDDYKWSIKSTNNTFLFKASQSEPKVTYEPETYFQRARSYATHPESDPSRYVRNLSKTGIAAFKTITWLDIGLE